MRHFLNSYKFFVFYELKEYLDFINCKKYFDKKSAWDFKPLSRNIYFSEDKKIAWWDEKLDTWMGVCAGAGIATLTKSGWKIRHYQLAMMIPNDKVKSVLEVLKKDSSKPEHKE